MRKQEPRKLRSKPHTVSGRIVSRRGVLHNQRVYGKSAGSRLATFTIVVVVAAFLVGLLCSTVFAMRSQLFYSAHKSEIKKIVKPSEEAIWRKELERISKKRAKDSINPNSYAVRSVLAKMSLEDKIAQMFIVKPEELVGFYGIVTSSGPQMQQAFNSLPVGGVMYSRENIQNPEQTKTMINGLQEMSEARVGLPAFISVDEEGGTVARVSSNPSMGVQASPNMRDVGATGKTRNAYKIGSYIGKYLYDFGFNVDFAPVADVVTNPDNKLMEKRAFGSKAQLVTRMTTAFADGLQDSHVFATYKHFPGHGSTFSDSHKGVTVSNQTSLALRKTDLVPFKDAVYTHAKFIMVSHVSYPKVTFDDTPASMSEKIITGIARKKLGYSGILISDSLGMGAITQRYDPGAAAITGIKAGLDMLLSSANLRQAYYAVVNAVRRGDISKDRIDESVKRIIAVKLQIAKYQKLSK